MTLQQLVDLDWDEIAVKMDGTLIDLNDNSEFDLGDIEAALAEVDAIREKVAVLKRMIAAANGETNNA